uniref:Protein kinase domain-containing protein n=1 Tax=Heterorhabditis bacteriophora TaxID=37862 RepID=A0A1I7XVE0_HETBA
MTSLLRGALNLIQGDTGVSGTGGLSHPLVGTDVEIGGVKFRIRNMIAEGGFAVVFSAQNQQGQWYALKRQLANDRESVEAVIQEIRVLREVSGHPAIIRFVQAAQMKIHTGGSEFLLLTELCPGFFNVLHLLFLKTWLISTYLIMCNVLDEFNLLFMYLGIIESCLQPNPILRPSIGDLVERIGALAAAMGIPPKGPVYGVDVAAIEGQQQQTASVTVTPPDILPSGIPPPRPPPPRTEPTDISQQASAVFGALKGQGLSLFKNIKDRSAAVVQTVQVDKIPCYIPIILYKSLLTLFESLQSTYGGRGPDVTWVTSRIAFSPLSDNVPEALSVQAEEALRSHIMDHGRIYFIINVSQR